MFVAIAWLISLWMAAAWVALIVMMVVTMVYEAWRPPTSSVVWTWTSFTSRFTKAAQADLQPRASS